MASLHPQGGFTGGALVNAAGAWGARIAAMLGEDIPLAARLNAVITAPLPHFVAPVVGVMGDVLSLKQFENGTVLIGGGRQGVAYPDENRTTVDLAGIAKCLATARRIFPVLKDATVVRTWAGIEGYPGHGADRVAPAGRRGARCFRLFCGAWLSAWPGRRGASSPTSSLCRAAHLERRSGGSLPISARDPRRRQADGHRTSDPSREGI